jgi:tetratricopeptide (TPR) repeat protein
VSETRTKCVKCGSDQLRWLTLRKGRIPVDVLQCQKCGVANAEEDWMAPLQAMSIGRCWNCGDRRDFESCVTCGLTRAEDVQVHDELRFMVDPNQSHLEAARQASRVGRRLLALKLATAAAATNENDQGEVARALRIWLLSAIGESEHAVDDARAWVESTQDPSALAWASYGQQLQAANIPGGAADAYEKSLKKQPKQHNIRARRSQILFELRRGGQAQDEALKVLSQEGVDEQSVAIASAVAGKLCDLFETEYRDDEIARLLDYAGEYVERSPSLLAHRARLAAQQGDLSSAKRDLKKARRMDPELEIYERVERAMKPARSSWWRW